MAIPTWSRNDAAVSKSLEKLSSGLKINRAADNAAGLVISEQMRAQISGIQQAMDNSEQAVTMVQTAEGALNEMNSLLSKVKSLALHVLNSGVTDSNQAARRTTPSYRTSCARCSASPPRPASPARPCSADASPPPARAPPQFQVGEQGTDKRDADHQLDGGRRSQHRRHHRAVRHQRDQRADPGLGRDHRGVEPARQARRLPGQHPGDRPQQPARHAREPHRRPSRSFAMSTSPRSPRTTPANSILIQSATAMLAQANQLPQNVLKLLG